MPVHCLTALLLSIEMHVSVEIVLRTLQIWMTMNCLIIYLVETSKLKLKVNRHVFIVF